MHSATAATLLGVPYYTLRVVVLIYASAHANDCELFCLLSQ